MPESEGLIVVLVSSVIVLAGCWVGQTTPVNQTLVSCIKVIEATYAERIA